MPLKSKSFANKGLFANKVLVANKGYLSVINESKMLVGVAMILLNIGSKYVDFKFTKAQEQLLRNGIAREILIFAIVFMGTRDIVYSLLLTAAFIILSEFAFNEKSEYCLVKKQLTRASDIINSKLSSDDVTPEEEQKALDVIRRAEKNRNSGIQSKISAFYDNNKLRQG